MLAEVAKKYLGIRYEWGGKNPPHSGLDCSGLVQMCFKDIGMPLPYTMNAQMIMDHLIKEDKTYQSINIDKDCLIFFGPSISEIKHVSIALNPYVMIEAASGGPSVSTLKDAIENKAFVLCNPISRRKDLKKVLKIV